MTEKEKEFICNMCGVYFKDKLEKVYHGFPPPMKIKTDHTQLIHSDPEEKKK